MVNKILLTQSVFEWLIEHLVFIEENADELSNFYYPNFPTEQEKMKLFFMKYIKKIEAELERINVVSSIEKFRYSERLNEFPFVIIGCQVKLINLAYNSEIYVRIIHPVEERKGQRDNEVTYLSALGKELLLEGVGRTVEIKTSTGLQHFRVESVKLL